MMHEEGLYSASSLKYVPNGSPYRVSVNLPSRSGVIIIFFFRLPNKKGRRTARSQVNSVQDGKQSKNH